MDIRCHSIPTSWPRHARDDVTGADVIAGYRHDRTMEGLSALYSYVYNGLISVLFG
jgi:hypothetical protein